MNKSKSLTIMAMFAAIIFLLAFTPLGFIPLPFVRATTIHIPVIIGSLFLGPKYGAALGFMFGTASFLIATFTPGPTSFAFSPFIPVPGSDSGNIWALFVAFVPRVCVGIVPFYIYALFEKLTSKRFNVVGFAVAGVAGSITNTILVMHSIFAFFGEPWAIASANPIDGLYAVIVSIIVGVGIPEAIVAGVLVAAISSALSVVLSKTQAA